MKPIPAILVDEDGNAHGLYDDDLREIGRIENVRRASHLRFDETRQEWTVVCAVTGSTVHRNTSREAAVAYEIQHFQPGAACNRQ